MPVTTDIVATYKGPRRVIAHLLSLGPREDRALAILIRLYPSDDAADEDSDTL